MDQVKEAFSIELAESLRQAYGGRIPSIATIARDFSLKSPHLPHISNETIRKWLRGESLPHISRMQVLIDWLGPCIAIPFEKPVKALQLAKRQTNHGFAMPNGEHPIHDALISTIEQLSERECQSILAIAKLLVEKHGVDTEAVVCIPSGPETTEI